ncbi:hypothetical protein [Thalassomonas actiniarum]|uniref:Uncharacterized protein n=1 Tax=Thalassomonas actiniarum TaxID=485447 RepID=A0AAE9YY04_9GAMM|nr:hypothetical protein [Thalassomonas actiniarum]WDE02434.1 hypothetical protein SG35_028905 [Thalassomonas actiniarum]
MRFHQLKEVYQHVIDINKELTCLYEYFLANITDERTRIFVHFVIQKQTDAISYLNGLIKTESKSVLDSWLDEDIENKSINYIRTLKQQPNVTIDDVLAISADINEKINSWLMIIIDVSTNQTVKEHIQNLIELQSSKYQQLLHSAHRMADI